MKELVVVPCYKRPEFLFTCITFLRAFDHMIPIALFPDRGTYEDKEFWSLIPLDENIHVELVPKHDYFGNTFNAMEALRWAYNSQAELVYYVEDDVFVHPDFFKWHREMHEELGNSIFASMGWIFNRYAPITQDVMFQPWYYSIGTCFSREKLALIVQHATPLYYNDMQGYIEKVFKGSRINSPFGIAHFEQDGLIQRVLDVDKTQTVSCGIAKCSHMGIFGYNRGWGRELEVFSGCASFEERLARLNQLSCDAYWRALTFGRDIVEREIGRLLPPRNFKYGIKVGDYESEFQSELSLSSLPQRINSVPRTPDMKIVLLSE